MAKRPSTSSTARRLSTRRSPPWDRAALDSRDIGQITLRLDETQKITNRYLWGPAVDQILADEQISWNAVAEDYDIEQILWPLADHQGTIRDLAKVNVTTGATDVVNNRTYDACGFLINETDTGVHHLFGFTARPSQTDAGLVNCLNRWYDPVIASWITEDPITFQGGDANLYRYCGNDPVNSVDPSGLSERMGMHWVPRAVIGRFLDRLSPEASKLFYSWTTDPWFYDHGSDPWGGVKHWQYNEAVETLLEARCRQLKPGDVLDEKAAREFIGWVLGTDKPETSILETPGVKEALERIRAYRRGFSQSVVAAFALKIQDPSLTREEIKVGVLALLNGKDSPKLSSKVLGAMRKVVQGGKPLLRYAGLPHKKWTQKWVDLPWGKRKKTVFPGGRPPDPREVLRFGPVPGVGKLVEIRGGETGNSFRRTPVYWVSIGARVAPQQSPILRSDNRDYTRFGLHVNALG